MCGIIGYTGPQPVISILLDGLKALEYRGYDSAGVALLGESEIKVIKRAGKVDGLIEAASGENGSHSWGIGHTRWATCGAPTQRNAHPHLDCSGRLALIHNGIIEGHLPLRAKLEKDGHKFLSETDTEVLVHLVESHVLDGVSLADAVRATIQQVEGSFAIAVVDRERPGTIVATRRNVPLLIGLGDGENFVVSDPVAALSSTRKFIPLEDNHVAEITPTSHDVLSVDGAPQVTEEVRITWNVESAQRDGHAHFMMKEILEQPAALRETLRGHVDAAGSLTLDHAGISPADLRKIEKIFIVACGSSLHAGLVAKYAIEHWTRIPVEIDVASEFRYRDPVLDSKTLVVGISQSGETADTLAAVRYARDLGARVVGITNVVGSSITRDTDAILYTHAGPEVGVAATKTLTTQMIVLWLLGLWIAESQEHQAVVEALFALPAQAAQLLKSASAIEKLALDLSKEDSFLFIGRGVSYPVALEGALKLKELSYLHAEGFAAGEMKHGPIALIDAGTPVVVIASESKVRSKVLSNAEEAKARGARIIAIASEEDAHIKALTKEVVLVPPVPELLSASINVIPLQLLAYHVAVQRGLDPDKPRNLAKSVTVE